MEIEITIKDKDQILGKRSALDFEGAEENLGKLERQFKPATSAYEQRSEFNWGAIDSKYEDWKDIEG